MREDDLYFWEREMYQREKELHRDLEIRRLLAPIEETIDLTEALERIEREMRFDLRNMMVIDIESTCWDDEKNRGDQINEVIEIGGAIVSRQLLEIHAEFQIYVWPRESTIGAFCAEYTGITYETLKAAPAIDFVDAMVKLAEIQRTYKCGQWASWGDYDRKMFETTCRRLKMDFPLDKTPHRNLKADEAWIKCRDRGIGQTRAAEAWGVPWEGRNHCGRDDARMAAKVFIEMSRKST